ncbi:MAG TPA: PAS domain S-box protein [Bacteroidales bacterium]|nr:PAS domain S-box protein [Bacteroidales bacterium]
MEESVRILCLEDLASDAALAEHEIRKTIRDYKLRLVENEKDFIGALKEFQPHLVISDYLLPTYNGVAALKTVLELSPSTPVIILTGSMNEDTAVECMKAGAIDYVIKEHIKRLGPAIINALEQRKIRWEKEESVRLLEMNEAKYRYMFANNPQPMWIYDLETLAFLEVNESAINHYGYSKQEFLKMTLKDIRPPEDIPVLLKDIETTRMNLNPAGTWRHIKKNGEIIYVEILSHSVMFGNRQARHVLIKDITVERNAKNELLLSEERFRNIFQDNISVMFLIDPVSGKILDVNKAAEEYYGWSRDEFLTKKIQEINTLKNGVASEIEKALDKRQIHFEFKHNRADGSIRDVEIFSSRIEIGGKPALHSIVYDISEKKAAEQRLKLLSLAIEQSPVSIIITDNDGIIEYVNPRFCDLTGYSHNELMGETPRILKSGHQSAKFYKELWETILSGSNWVGEFQNKKKNGDLYWESAIIAPLVSSNGRISHFIAIKEDITEKKILYENLVQAKEKAEESDRLKTAFLHNISHEIRTPLNAIIGFSGFLDQPDLSEKDRKQFIDIIFQSNNQLLTIINDILNISQIETSQVVIRDSWTDLKKLTESLYRRYKPDAVKAGIEFSVAADNEKESRIYTDESKLLQVLTNLLGNAFKFTHEGFVQFGYNIREEVVEFFVEDSGIGIPESEQKKIFDRFYQVDKKVSRLYSGTGLGLSISDAYVKLLGGSFTVRSSPGTGSRFSFAIPIDKGGQPQSRQVIPHLLRSDSTVKTILVAEDEESNFALVNAILKPHGYTLLRAKNGREAVDMCKTKDEIDLVLLDIKMPVMDGFEAAREILKQKPGLPIIAQTAYAHPSDRSRAIESGCIDYLAKPFDRRQLMDMISKYLK